MQTHRILSGLTILVMVVLVAAGWFLVAQPQLAAAATANDSLANVQTQIQSTQATIAQLKSEQKKSPEFSRQLAELRLSIPPEANSSSYIDGLNALAATAGVTITAITVNDALQYSPPGAAASSTTPATPGSSPSTKPTPTPTPTPSGGPSAAAQAAAGWVPPSDPRITAANFIAIPVSITTDGTWDGDLAFIKGLQSGKRLFLINGIATAPDTSGSELISAKITGYIYVLLDPKVAALALKTGGFATPTPTPTPTVSTSPNPSGSSTPTPTTSPTP